MDIKKKRRPQQANNAGIEESGYKSGSSLETSAKHMAHMSNSSKRGSDKVKNKGKSIHESPINPDFSTFAGAAGFIDYYKDDYASHSSRLGKNSYSQYSFSGSNHESTDLIVDSG